MGYRDDFFIVQNIIGYTGPLHELPSVYFRTKLEYGHITQVHPHSFNWGRTEVKTDPDWKITNECPGPDKCRDAPHSKRSHEINGQGRAFHRSRDLFVEVTSQEERAILAQAIYRCPLMKTDPHGSDDRKQQERDYKDLWEERHERPGGRRGAIDYTGERLANRLLGVAYPNRVKG